MEFKNKLPEGVGRKIVDALKKQSEIEVTANDSDENNFFQDEYDINEKQSDVENSGDFSYEEDNNNYYQLENQELSFEEEPVVQAQEERIEYQESPAEMYIQKPQNPQPQFVKPRVQQQQPRIEQPVYEQPQPRFEQPQPRFEQQQPRFEQPRFEQPRFEQQNFEMPKQVAYAQNEFNQSDWEGMDVPANIEVLKRLISQLPAGVTRQTGAQIIRQTMEAMGISMNSVLAEAQQVQEDLGKSSKDCLNTIEEYKNNIKILERKVQTYKKQADQLGDLINLFILTDKKR